MRAGVVSDIHGSYDRLNQATEAMGPIDLLIHAGDGFNELARWRKEHPRIQVRMVAGNCDLYADCPEEVTFNLDRWQVLLTHGHLYGAKANLTRLWLRARQAGASLVIFGHTHRAEKVDRHGIIFFNPGSLSQFRPPGILSYGTIDVGPEGLEAEIRYL